MNLKQKEFVKAYFETGNGARAYQRIYGGTYNAANVSACRLLKRKDIQKELERLAAEAGEKLNFDLAKLCLRTLAADILDFYELKGDRLELRQDLEQMDTSIIQGIRKRKTGDELILLDKQKAAELLLKMGYFTQQGTSQEQNGIYGIFKTLSDEELRAIADNVGSINTGGTPPCV